MTSKIFDIIIYVLFATLCIYGIKKNTTSDKKQSLDKLNSLRGIFAIEIVIGHAVRHANSYLMPFGKFMMIAVGYFFFISAFGMVTSLQTKDSYLNGFCRRKIGYLFLSTIIAFIINFTLDMLFPANAGYLCNIHTLPFTYFTKTNWYMFELILFYGIFFIAYKYIKHGGVLRVTLQLHQPLFCLVL